MPCCCCLLRGAHVPTHAGPNHPEASKLAQRFHTQAAKRRHKSSGSGAAAAALPDNMSEDDQLALALAMSVEVRGGGPGGLMMAACARPLKPAIAQAYAYSEDLCTCVSPGTSPGLQSSRVCQATGTLCLSRTAYATVLCLCVLCFLQGGGGGAGFSGRQDSLGDVDEQAIWQEIEKRQKLEEAAAAAAGSGSSQAAATKQQQPSAAAAAPAAPPAALDVNTLQAAAAARLPPEPAAGGCRVAFRLPDGSRVQRNFNTSDTVTALQVRGSKTRKSGQEGVALTCMCFDVTQQVNSNTCVFLLCGTYSRRADCAGMVLQLRTCAGLCGVSVQGGGRDGQLCAVRSQAWCSTPGPCSNARGSRRGRCHAGDKVELAAASTQQWGVLADFCLCVWPTHTSNNCMILGPRGLAHMYKGMCVV